MDLLSEIKDHYQKHWGHYSIHKFEKGPINELPLGFFILRFKPSPNRKMWTYATCGMSSPKRHKMIEIHIFSYTKNDFLIELLTAIAHYHCTGAELGLGHTVNFGQPWYANSKCEYGLISLPYLDGSSLEWMNSQYGNTQFLWLLPITREEVMYKKKYGLEALEEQFEKGVNYLDYFRESMVK